MLFNSITFICFHLLTLALYWSTKSSRIRSIIPLLKKMGILDLVKKTKELNLTEREEGKEVMDPIFRQKLVKYFEEDLNNLEILVEKDLSHWKK